jgi:hypothetical protein
MQCSKTGFTQKYPNQGCLYSYYIWNLNHINNSFISTSECLFTGQLTLCRQVIGIAIMDN